MTDCDHMFQELLSRNLCAQDDQTVYLPANEFPCPSVQPEDCPPSDDDPSLPAEKLSQYLWRRYPHKEPKNPASLDLSVTTEPPEYPKEAEVRIQASRCFRSQGWSFTLRGADGLRKQSNGKKANRKAPPTGGSRPHPRLSVQEWMSQNASSLSGYAPASDHVHQDIKDVSIASFAETGDAILDLLWESPATHLKGLLFITGETKCGKSYIGRGIIQTYLRNLQYGPNDRNPHLVTFEDPIEKWFYRFSELKAVGAFSALERRVDYTPREKSIDCQSFHDFTNDALRQTPTVLFAGELRDAKDLAEAVAFGGTGHFIVATGHAGSLVEAADKIFSALETSNSLQRAAGVPKLLGIAHLKKMTAQCLVKNRIRNSSIIVPALYRRCSAGMQALVSDGLASLLPYCPTTMQEGKQFGSLGRQFMVRQILSNPKGSTPFVSSHLCKAWDRAQKNASSLQSGWVGAWERLRRFHAGTERPDSDSGDGQCQPLWMKCAEDDLNAI
jgi:Type II/IV secretion system protein